MNKVYITKVEKTDKQYYQYPIIIHRGMWHFARFNTMEQLQEFLEITGLKIEKTEEKQTLNNGLLEIFSLSHNIKEEGYFWKFEDVPNTAKKIKGLSNGSIVDCYFLTDETTLYIYRPNPNAKEVYKPMKLEEEIEYRRTHWYF